MKNSAEQSVSMDGLEKEGRVGWENSSECDDETMVQAAIVREVAVSSSSVEFFGLDHEDGEQTPHEKERRSVMALDLLSDDDDAEVDVQPEESQQQKEKVNQYDEEALSLSRYLACSDRGWPWAGKDIVWAEYVSLNGHHR